ncbi:hypothetical protein G7046_g5014 [Stylonectria norvegica]|nr:hypothetical protein G7046_g5014 [Stylonectria norvegica]
MATSSAASLRRSHGSSGASSKHSHDEAPVPPSISIDTLVNHLLIAKRSLSSMTLVFHANELATAARHSHEDVAILAAQAGFLRSSILDQAAVLVRVRRSLQATYDWGKKDFTTLVRSMDLMDGELEGTMEMLRGTVVQSVFRPKGEERKSLLDFVDEESGIQQSFDGDLLRFDSDIRNLKKTIVDSPAPLAHDDSDAPTPSVTELLESLIDHSATMAQLLVSLTRHFDMCVTAIRTTDGAVALARRKVAEVTQSQGGDGVSISGVIAKQESDVSDLEPKTAKDRDEMLKVVVQDAEEVDYVVQEIQSRLVAMEEEYAILEEQTKQTKGAYTGMLEAYAILGDIGDRLGNYLAAEEDFRTRWEVEKEAVFGKLQEMQQMREFYEGYASAYDSLILEVERRRAVDDRVKSVWRKAQENVDKLLDADQLSREAFRQDVGEFLPTDLWAGMQGSAKRWAVERVKGGGETADADGEGEGESKVLRRSVVEAARKRLEKMAASAK